MRLLCSSGELEAGGRQLLALWAFESNPTVLWVIIALGGLVGLLLAIGLALLLYYKCCRTSAAAVAPHPDDQAVAEDDSKANGSRNTASSKSALSQRAVPPWEASGQLPPGIMLAPSTPATFEPVLPKPRQPGEQPYQRLVLVSSRVREAYAVGLAALPHAAVLVYDWKSWTLQELLGHVKRSLGAKGRVASIAVIAPGGKPGSVSLLEGWQTSAAKLADPERKELAQFWRALSAHVEAQAGGAGGRIDLLGCRMAEAPADGAALLKALWQLTGLPFAASDDAMGGFRLCTFAEVPAAAATPATPAGAAPALAAAAAAPGARAATPGAAAPTTGSAAGVTAGPAGAAAGQAGQLGLVVSQVSVMDVYFDAAKLLGVAVGMPGNAVSKQGSSGTQQQPPGPPPPLPPGAPPPFALERAPAATATGRAVLAPLPGAASAAAPLPVALPPNAAVAAVAQPLQPQASWPQLVAGPSSDGVLRVQQPAAAGAPAQQGTQVPQQGPASNSSVATKQPADSGQPAASGPGVTSPASATPSAQQAATQMQSPPAASAQPSSSNNSAPPAAASTNAPAAPAARTQAAAVPQPPAPAETSKAATPAAPPAASTAPGPTAVPAPEASKPAAVPACSSVPATPAQPAVPPAAQRAGVPAPSANGPQPQTAVQSAPKAEPNGAAPAAAVAPAASQKQAPLLAQKDIFGRFSDGMRAKGFGIEALFRTYDADRSGALQQAEVVKMIMAVVPDASSADTAHLKALLDIDGNDSVTLAELKAALDTGARLATTVAARADTTDVMSRLREYLTDNEQVMRQVFEEFDQDKSGGLDHVELAQLVTMIPGLSSDEQKYIMAYLYQEGDTSGDGRVSFDEITALVARFKAGQGQKQTAGR